MSPSRESNSTEGPRGTAGTASVVDHVGAVRDPYRVTIMALARRNETYEIRWRENVRHDDGTVSRERRSEPGGHSKAGAYAKAEKVHRNLERSNGYHGAPARPAGTPKAPPKPKTLVDIAALWLNQHPSNADKPATVEGYASLLANNILPKLSYTETRGRQKTTRTVELGVMAADDIARADVNHWIIALSKKPDARRKGETVFISSSTVNSCLRVLNACLNWGVAHGYLTANPAHGVDVTVHGARQPEWFRTPDDFWNALDAIDAKWDGTLHDMLVVLVYLGLRVNELAALEWDDLDLTRKRVNIRHNFDKKRRRSTVKSEESETWLPLHEEAETAILAEKDRLGDHAKGAELVFRGPRGGVVTSTLINDALAHGCQATGLSYRVTAHGLRHSFGNWLKNAGVPTRDIQAVLRHADQRTTNGYLHTSTEEKIAAVAKLPSRPSTGMQSPSA